MQDVKGELDHCPRPQFKHVLAAVAAIAVEYFPSTHKVHCDYNESPVDNE